MASRPRWLPGFSPQRLPESVFQLLEGPADPCRGAACEADRRAHSRPRAQLRLASPGMAADRVARPRDGRRPLPPPAADSFAIGGAGGHRSTIFISWIIRSRHRRRSVVTTRNWRNTMRGVPMASWSIPGTLVSKWLLALASPLTASPSVTLGDPTGRNGPSHPRRDQSSSSGRPNRARTWRGCWRHTRGCCSVRPTSRTLSSRGQSHPQMSCSPAVRRWVRWRNAYGSRDT